MRSLISGIRVVRPDLTVGAAGLGPQRSQWQSVLSGLSVPVSQSRFLGTRAAWRHALKIYQKLNTTPDTTLGQPHAVPFDNVHVKFQI